MGSHIAICILRKSTNFFSPLQKLKLSVLWTSKSAKPFRCYELAKWGGHKWIKKKWLFSALLGAPVEWCIAKSICCLWSKTKRQWSVVSSQKVNSLDLLSPARNNLHPLVFLRQTHVRVLWYKSAFRPFPGHSSLACYDSTRPYTRVHEIGCS